VPLRWGSLDGLDGSLPLDFGGAVGSWAAGLLALTAWAALTPSSNTLEQGRQSITPLCARCSLETAVPRTAPSLLD